jgi:hypothetical protein
MAGRGWRISAAPGLKSFGAVFLFGTQRRAQILSGKQKAPEAFASRAFLFLNPAAIDYLGL